VFEAAINDLGGESETSEAERSIARRAATLAVELAVAGATAIGAVPDGRVEQFDNIFDPRSGVKRFVPGGRSLAVEKWKWEMKSQGRYYG
jgi:hypothetical protein